MRLGVIYTSATERASSMCGICDVYGYRTGKPTSECVLRAMLAAIQHRRPDDEGTYVDREVGLDSLHRLQRALCRMIGAASCFGRRVLWYFRFQHGHLWFNGFLPYSCGRWC